MYTQKVKIEGLLKNLECRPIGESLHCILLEQDIPETKVEGHGTSGVMSIKQFNQKVEGQANTVATKDGMIHFARVVRIGDGEMTANRFEKDDIVRIVPENKSNFMPVDNKLVTISSTIVVDVYRKHFED